MTSSKTFYPSIFHGPTSPPPGSVPAQPYGNLGLVVLFFWLVFLAYWAISAFNVKKNIKAKGNSWKSTVGIRVLILAIVILIFAVFGNVTTQLFFNPQIQLLGVVFVVVGIAFAIWARRHLGSNWSGHPTVKEGHELVTSGPYSFVHHPIYTGMLLAMFGSMLVIGAIWLIIFIGSLVMFIWRIKVEEGFMVKLFPDTYPEYKKRTKALIPFVW